MKRCFFDIVVDGVPKGRIAFELDDEKYPIAAENFYHLCIGDKENKKGEKLWYKGCRFHNIRNDAHVLIGGDITYGNGTGGESIYGPIFHREPRKSDFAAPGSLAMVIFGEGLNDHSSVFFITGEGDQEAFPTSNPFGRAIDGLELINELAEYGDATGAPTKEIVIGDCNAMPC